MFLKNSTHKQGVLNMHTATATFGSPAFVQDRASFYGEFLFKDEIEGDNPASFIADYCQKAFERLRAYSRQAQERHAKNERALVALAGKVKYANAHLELAQCYGKQLGIMTENQMFRQHAIAFLSLAHAELEVLEYFDFNN